MWDICGLGFRVLLNVAAERGQDLGAIGIAVFSQKKACKNTGDAEITTSIL